MAKSKNFPSKRKEIDTLILKLPSCFKKRSTNYKSEKWKETDVGDEQLFMKKVTSNLVVFYSSYKIFW